ncbi:MAG: hypothetical protein U5K29_00685 [Acidimicrobiales bacterium]|nr:hypothetical protein [Acidimicrobiales bacterium]
MTTDQLPTIDQVPGLKGFDDDYCPIWHDDHLDDAERTSITGSRPIRPRAWTACA